MDGDAAVRGEALPQIPAHPSNTGNAAAPGAGQPSPPRRGNDMLERARRQLQEDRPRLAQYAGGRPWKIAAKKMGVGGRAAPISPAEVLQSLAEQMKPPAEGRAELSKREMARLVVDSAKLAETSTKLKTACSRALRIAGDVEKLHGDDDSATRAQQRYEAVRTEGCRVVVLADKDDEDMYEQLLATQRALADAQKAAEKDASGAAGGAITPRRPTQGSRKGPRGSVGSGRTPGQVGRDGDADSDGAVDPEIAELLEEPPEVDVPVETLSSSGIVHAASNVMADSMLGLKNLAAPLRTLRRGLGDLETDQHRLTTPQHVHTARVCALKLEYTFKKVSKASQAVHAALRVLVQTNKEEATLAAKEICELRRDLAEANATLRDRERQMEELLSGGGGGGAPPKSPAVRRGAKSPRGKSPQSPAGAMAMSLVDIGPGKHLDDTPPSAVPKADRRPAPLAKVGSFHLATSDMESPSITEPTRAGKLAFASQKALLGRLQRSMLYTISTVGVELEAPPVPGSPQAGDAADPASPETKGKKKGRKAKDKASSKKGAVGVKEKTEIETLLQYQRTLHMEQAAAARDRERTQPVAWLTEMLCSLFWGRHDGQAAQVDDITPERGALYCVGLKKSFAATHSVALALRSEIDRAVEQMVQPHHTTVEGAPVALPKRLETASIIRLVGAAMRDLDTLSASTHINRTGYVQVLDMIHDREVLRPHIAHFSNISPRLVAAYALGPSGPPAPRVLAALDVLLRWMDGGDGLGARYCPPSEAAWGRLKTALSTRAEEILAFLVDASPRHMTPPQAAQLLEVRDKWFSSMGTPDPVAVLATPFASLPHYIAAFADCLERRMTPELPPDPLAPPYLALEDLSSRAATGSVDGLSAAAVAVSMMGHMAHAVGTLAGAWNVMLERANTKRRYLAPATQKRGLI